MTDKNKKHKMQRNMIKDPKKLRFLGFLGLLGLLGIPTKNYGFFGFFGFFSFFAASARPDERLTQNTYQAGFYAFVASLLCLSVLITALSMKMGLAMMSLIIAAAFIVTILTFVISFLLIEKI